MATRSTLTFAGYCCNPNCVAPLYLELMLSPDDEACYECIPPAVRPPFALLQGGLSERTTPEDIENFCAMKELAELTELAAESRARDWYTQCCARSAQRAAAGAPSFEEMCEEYQSLVEYGGEFIPTVHFLNQDALGDAIDEEYIAQHGIEECIRQEVDRMSSNLTRPSPLMLVSNN
jgi:hypothetical protein